jgi:hypothetical protein
MAFAIKTRQPFWIGGACVTGATFVVAIYLGFSGKVSIEKSASTGQVPPPRASSQQSHAPARGGDSKPLSTRAGIHAFATVDDQALKAWMEHGKHDPLLSEFAAWVEKARLGDLTATEEDGVRLAERRRERLAEIIQTDPRRALDLAMPKDLIAALSARVAALAEEHVAGRGRLAVLGAIPEVGATNFVSTFRVATIHGTEYSAFAYGRRLGEPTRENVLMHGVALKSSQDVRPVFAVHESPARLLSKGEVARLNLDNADPVCAVSGLLSTTSNEQTVLDAGGDPVFACGPTHALLLQHQIAAADGENVVPGAGDVAADESHTEGRKRLLLIRVDFPDFPGEPFTDTEGFQLVTNMNSFWADASYGKVTVPMPGQGSAESSDVTPTFRLTNNASYYATNNSYDGLRAAARAAADAAGFYRTNYEFDITCIGPVPGFNWRGLGYVGANGAWIRGSFSTGTIAHELGHNLGLNHANFWDTANTSAIGPGISVEYGDGFDVMGSDGGARPHNARYRAYLNWLTATDVATFSTNGVYRIMAFDVTNSTGLRALKIIRNAGSESTNQYWLEYHAMDRANTWERAGAELRWAGSGNQKSQLIDATPGSPYGISDAPIPIGRTFVDNVFNIYVTPLRKTGTTPESLDIFVFRGATPSNAPPALTISATTTNPALNASVTFSAVASDPNGDPIAYHWDFGDGSLGTNGNAITKIWSNPGEYVVLCTVTDMKGGEARSRLIVSVGSPATYRISGRVLNDGNPVQGVRVFASSAHVTYTDNDGYYDLVNLNAGSYTLGAVLEGYIFTNSGFANPVAVGPSAQAINFTGNMPSNALPTVAITNPAPDAVFSEGSDVVISATASAVGAKSITNVEFFVSGINLAQPAATARSATWSNTIFGTYALTARAIDSAGMVATSAPVVIAISRVIFPRGSLWKYLDDGSDQGTNWTGLAFNDSAWAPGAGRLGYGGDGEATTVDYGPNATGKHITTYFRRAFELPPGIIASNLIVRWTRDDGAVAYLDGAEVFRDNIQDNPITFLTAASADISNQDETNFFEMTFSGALLAKNTNMHVIAAEVHQAAADSDDLGFDLELVATGVLVPQLTVRRIGSRLELSWPAMVENWNLYAADSMSPAAQWLPVTSVNVVNGMKTVTIPPYQLSGFYRLRNP